MVATKAPNQGQARPGRSKATAPSGASSDHRITLETAEHDGPQCGRDENQKQLRRAQERKASGSRKDDETDRRSGDVRPWRERDFPLTDEPVQQAPHEAGREDDERDPDEEALPEALVGRVARVRSDGEDAIAKRRGHDRRA
jgi:hypothetical protein